jgi:hypothetical protein
VLHLALVGAAAPETEYDQPRRAGELMDGANGLAKLAWDCNRDDTPPAKQERAGAVVTGTRAIIPSVRKALMGARRLITTVAVIGPSVLICFSEQHLQAAACTRQLFMG